MNRQSPLYTLDGSLPVQLLHPLLRDLAHKNAWALRQLDGVFPDYPPSALLNAKTALIPRALFAGIYGRAAILLAAQISGEDQATAAAEYTSRVDFMLTVLLSSKTLWDAVDNMARFNAMLTDHGVSISGDHDRAFDRITIDLHYPLPNAPLSLLSVCILFIVNMFSWLAGSRIAISEIDLAYPVNEPVDPCLRNLDVPVRLGQSRNAIRFMPGTFDRLVIDQARHQRGTIHLLCHDPGYLGDLDRSFAVRVSQAFTRLCGATGRCPDRLTVCAFMGISPSTLHRNLKANDTSFQAEKTAWQTATALRMIHNGDTMDTIARTLGFHGARSFRRAFLEWTGRLPSSFRGQRTSAAPDV